MPARAAHYQRERVLLLPLLNPPHAPYHSLVRALSHIHPSAPVTATTIRRTGNPPANPSNPAITTQTSTTVFAVQAHVRCVRAPQAAARRARANGIMVAAARKTPTAPNALPT